MLKKEGLGSRGQAALEYLTTYGWVLIVIVISVGFIAYFGFLDPYKFIPERCYFGGQLVCTDHSVQTNTLAWRVRNNFGVDIEITNVEAIDPNFALQNCDVGEIISR